MDDLKLEISKELQETLDRFREVNSRQPVTIVSRSMLMWALMLIERQEQQIKYLEEKLAEGSNSE